MTLNDKSYNKWHEKLEHRKLCAIKKMINVNLVPRISISSKCKLYIQGKFVKDPYFSILFLP